MGSAVISGISGGAMVEYPQEKKEQAEKARAAQSPLQPIPPMEASPAEAPADVQEEPAAEAEIPAESEDKENQ